MSIRFVAAASFSMASAIIRMILGAAPKFALPKAQAVALPILSLVLVSPAKQQNFHMQKGCSSVEGCIRQCTGCTACNWPACIIEEVQLPSICQCIIKFSVKASMKMSMTRQMQECLNFERKSKKESYAQA